METRTVNRKKWQRHYSTSNTRIAANLAKQHARPDREVRVRYDETSQLCVVEWRNK
jgi:uncharacterized protein RhaS with RHS repeats